MWSRLCPCPRNFNSGGRNYVVTFAFGDAPSGVKPVRIWAPLTGSEGVAFTIGVANVATANKATARTKTAFFTPYHLLSHAHLPSVLVL